MKKFLPLFVLLILAGTLFFMGQNKGDFNPEDAKWNKDPRMMQLQASQQTDNVPVQINENVPRTFTSPVLHNTPAGMLLVNPNVRVHPTTWSTQSEVPITRHPTNQNILYASSNAVKNPTSPLFISEGCYVSTNGGATWFGSDTTNSAPIGNHGGDPAPAIGLNGYFYMSLGKPA